MAPRLVGLMDYAELHCQTAFSFLEGASMPEELVARAAGLGLSAIGVGDRDAVYGMVRAWKTGKQHGVDVLHGALLSVRDPTSPMIGKGKGPDRTGLAPVLVYAEDEVGWSSLCELLSLGRADQKKGSPLLELPQLLEHSAGLLALVDGSWDASPLADAFDDRLYIEVSRLLRADDGPREEQARALARRLDRPPLATNRVQMHDPSRKQLQDALSSIRNRTTVDQAGHILQPNAERHLKSAARMSRLFAGEPQLLRRTVEVAERARFRLDTLHYEYPSEVVPDGHTAMSWLVELVRQGCAWRWPDGTPDDQRAQIDHELALIDDMDFAAYFLTVYDIVRFAREQRILCQGRGSAANSVVCYALGITAVDPSRQRVLFERFISKERGEPPDIDVDFEHERREEVIQYVYAKYGRHRAALVNEIISYRPKSAIRDMGKAMGLSLDQVDRLAKNMDWWDEGGPSIERVAEVGLDPTDMRIEHALELAVAVQGFPRHLSIHVGGFVISEQPLRHRCPIEPAAMQDRTVIQWDKDDIDAVNFVKVDVLALGILTAIRKCFDLVRAHHGHDLTLATTPSEDAFVYDMICRADTMGTFQIESRAQMSMLPRLKPRNFYDLVIEVSIVRPGPIQGGMVHPYLDRRSGVEPVRYAHPDLEPILARTLGVPIFQEQVMEMAMTVGGFSAGEADELRRAMGAWRKRGGLGPLVEQLKSNMEERGLDPAYADQVARQIIGFGEYGFPESHAASFALLVYVSCYLKCYFPAAFCASLLNAQPMGFYSARNLIDGARRHGAEARPVRISISDWNNTLEPDGRVDPLDGGRDRVVAGGVALRMGLRQVSGFGEEAGLRVEQAREQAPFRGIADLATRAGLDKGDLLALARADALSCFGMDRRQACWEVEGLWTSKTPLLAGLPTGDGEQTLPVATAYEELQQDYLSTGLSLSTHPLAIARPALDGKGVVRIEDLADHEPGDAICIAGLVVNRQRPGTANGVVFMTLEDETGMANLVIWPSLFKRQRRLCRAEPLVRVWGLLQREGDAFSIVTTRFARLPLDEVRAPSRDFR
ncbi:MAG: DNA polymerase III subunit alpha [Proteobacteria bacterium]|nr:DNA polymerase III subunit alpha [Pseudomonadota bacterium]MCP4918353.1 DNA polymerase III subunit alpha [Pseudomonadota bacterium]